MPLQAAANCGEIVQCDSEVVGKVLTAQVQPDCFDQRALYGRDSRQLVQHFGAERPDALDLDDLFR
jgi:hypothetical protein